MGIERMKVGVCPLCQQAHGYKLQVEREIISGLATQPQAFRRTSFILKFNCPVENDEFSAKVTLAETAMNPIMSVEVIGVDEDENSS